MKGLLIRGAIVTAVAFVGVAYLAIPKGPSFEQRWAPVHDMQELQRDNRHMQNPLYHLPKADRRIWDAHRRYAACNSFCEFP
jgi:hypothetical protein